jgi:hypothetical protein
LTCSQIAFFRVCIGYAYFIWICATCSLHVADYLRIAGV